MQFFLADTGLGLKQVVFSQFLEGSIYLVTKFQNSSHLLKYHTLFLTTFINLFLMSPKILNVIIGPEFSMIQASLYRRNNCSREVESKAYFQCLGKMLLLRP